MKSKSIRKIEKKPLKDKVTSVRLTQQQRDMIDASAKINNVNRSIVMQEAVNEYFDIKN